MAAHAGWPVWPLQGGIQGGGFGPPGLVAACLSLQRTQAGLAALHGRGWALGCGLARAGATARVPAPQSWLQAWWQGWDAALTHQRQLQEVLGAGWRELLALSLGAGHGQEVAQGAAISPVSTRTGAPL